MGSSSSERAGALALRARRAGDCGLVVGWVLDPEAMLLFTGYRLQWPLTGEQLLKMEEQPGFTGWIMTEDDVPVAHFDLTVAGESARLGRVIIDPSQRGRGLARVLTGYAVEQARTARASELNLTVMRGNEPAIRAYLSAGFRFGSDDDRVDAHAMTLPVDET